jgi:hypothetical protein
MREAVMGLFEVLPCNLYGVAKEKLYVRAVFTVPLDLVEIQPSCVPHASHKHQYLSQLVPLHYDVFLFCSVLL